MNNIGLKNLKVASVDTFTTNVGIKLRRVINPALRQVLKLATKRKIIVESYPNLNPKKNYIFASTHSFDEDIIAGLATIKHPKYVLMGTTDQIDHNPQMYAAWLNGMIYVNRLDPESRKESVKKMERILNSGSSVLLFPEGGWNNTENLICQKLFAGPYILAQKTGVEVVPISAYNAHNSNEIYINVGEPLDLSNLSKEEAKEKLRDELATMMYLSMEKHAPRVRRKDLSENARLEYMEERKNEYLRVKWTRDVWDEELTVYSDNEVPLILKDPLEKKYDFKEYMHKNWNK